MKIRALVADDEPLARKRLRRLLDEHEDVEVVGEAAAGDETVDKVLEERPDVLFLDIRMPGQDGIQAFRELRAKLPGDVLPLAVFTTAHEEHAVEAFELEGTDYLVKPLDDEQLERALRRVRREVWRRDRPVSPERAAPEDAATEDTDVDEDVPGEAPEDVGHLAGHRANKIVRLALDEIGAVTVNDTITWAHTPEGKVRLRQPLSELEERLPCPPFVRVSRSAMVSLEWIDHLAPMFSGTYSAFLREPLDLEIHVSRRRARNLRKLLGW